MQGIKIKHYTVKGFLVYVLHRAVINIIARHGQHKSRKQRIVGGLYAFIKLLLTHKQQLIEFTLFLKKQILFRHKALCPLRNFI